MSTGMCMESPNFEQVEYVVCTMKSDQNAWQGVALNTLIQKCINAYLFLSMHHAENKNIEQNDAQNTLKRWNC